MPGRSIRVARIAGIPVGISPLWLIIVGLITWTLGADYYPSQVRGIAPLASYALGLASALLLFASILAHEFGHALVARRRGVEIEEIDLWLLGGVARMSGRPHSAGDELRFALAGPMVTAVVALAFGALALGLPSQAPSAARALIAYEAEVNLLILGFNLVPAFPLDGGRVARALLWRRTGDIARATEIAAALGRGFGYLLVGGGVFLWFSGVPSGLWFALIGVFVIAAANAERMQEQAVAMFTGVSAGAIMSHPAVTVPAASSVSDAIQYFIRHRFTAFPVTDAAGRALGLLRITGITRLPRSQWVTTRVEEVVDRDPALLIGEHEDVADLLDRSAFQRVGRAVVVDDDGRPVGIVSVTDIERTLRATHIGGRPGASSRLAPHR